ncbi:MAG: sugar phosphate isomerase/epimerase, partial [Defluviitaleaceae bacterium]|nr:sugar phosphate isomerase/epimerase [Defluviitaleaceae bacterium]
MRFGYCLNLQFLEGDDLSRRIFDAVCESGFDYVEFPLNALSALSPDKIAGLKRELAAKGVPCRACNLFFPFDMPIVGPERDRKVIRNYIEKAIATAADIGMETAVFGNGGARRANDGLSKAGVYADLRDIIEMMDPIAEKNGVTITVEPLNQKETNMINSYTEAVQLTEGAK